MPNLPARPTAEGSRILAQWNLERRRAGLQRGGRLQPVRGFAAAEVSRLTSSMQADHGPMNQDLEYALRLMVGRSRRQFKDNDYVRKFGRMCQRHIVGPEGFRLHVPCTRPDGSLDEADSLVVEKSFARWGKRGVCDVTGKFSFRQICMLLVLCAARDGECLVRRIRNPKANAFGYQLQVIDPVLLDYTYRADLANGNKVRMGVEFNEWGKPQAYHLLSNVENGLSQRRTRVPAEEIFHFFISEEPDQVRAAPWIHTALRRLNDLGGYEEAAIVAARVGASQMGFFLQSDSATAGGVDPAQLGDGLADDTDPDSATTREATPGTFDLLPKGIKDFKAFDPDYPHQNYDAFVKACLRGISSGLDVDYNTLGNDLEGVNFSSIRHGMLETREAWMALQNWFKESFLEPLYTEWLEMAFVSGQLGNLPVAKFDKYDVALWQGRRWSWVDPLKDGQATELLLENGLTSHSAVIRESGRDPETVYREIEKDKKRLKDLLPEKKPKKPGAKPDPEEEPDA